MKKFLSFILALTLLFPLEIVNAANVQTYNKQMYNSGYGSTFATDNVERVFASLSSSPGMLFQHVSPDVSRNTSSPYASVLFTNPANYTIRVRKDSPTGEIVYQQSVPYYYAQAYYGFDPDFDAKGANVLYYTIQSTPGSVAFSNVSLTTSRLWTYTTEVDQISMETLQSAKDAKTAAQNAETSANQAAQNASLAKDYAYNAWQETINTKNQVIQSETNIKNKLDSATADMKNEFRTRLAATETNIRGDISTLNTDLNKKLANINTSITNMQNMLPPTLTKVSGYNRATATRTGTLKVSLDYTGANEFRYKVGNGGWSSWASLSGHDNDGYFLVGGIGWGVHDILVEIRQATASTDPATGNPTTLYSPVAKGKMTVFAQ